MADRDDLSMSTDNTPEGEMYSDTVEAGPISHIHIDDRVVDATGKEIGSVKFVKMGDPNAATDKGQVGYEGVGLFGFGDPYDLGELPEQAQEQLLRVGFIHIDVPMARDRFAGAGQIARVEANTVYLTVPEDALI
jgi:hypothetical protein